MKRIIAVSSLVAVVMLSLGFDGVAAKVTAKVVAGVDAKADFSGTWVMDRSRSEGVPPDMEQTMKITQADDTLGVETKVVTDQGDQTINASYTLNGKETAYTPKRGGVEGKGRRTVKWTSDGNGFEATEEEKFDSPSGEVTFQFTRRWQMLPDGRSLIIELEVKGTNGPQHSKRMFVKR
jgi:hypothetical protein